MFDLFFFPLYNLFLRDKVEISFGVKNKELKKEVKNEKKIYREESFLINIRR